ncbi:hypothetical protein D3C75_1014320 [compost metagenome]
MEVDGQLVSGLNNTEYKHSGLEPNTMHVYRVRAKNTEGISAWSDKLKKVTTPALTIKPEKDTQFNFVMVIPQKNGKTERKVTVTYNANDLEVFDLRAETPDPDLKTGIIKGTTISVTSFEPGKIVYSIQTSDKAAINTFIFFARTNEFTEVTYSIE